MKEADDKFLDPIDTDPGDGQPPASGGEAPRSDGSGDTAKSNQADKRGADTAEAHSKGKGDLNEALRQARDETKAERKRLAELEARYGRLEQNTNRLLERFTAPEPQQPAQQENTDPEPGDDDPVAQLAWQRRQFKNLAGYVLERDQRQQVELQRQQENLRIHNEVNAYWMQREAEVPEIKNAYNHMLNSWAREFASQGRWGMLQDGRVVPGSPLDVAVREHETEHMRYCYFNRIPIDQYYVNQAMIRGWQPPAQQEQQPDETQEQRDARARDEKGRFVKADDGAEQRASQLAASQQANRSLSQGSGSPTKKMDAKELSMMSEEDMWKVFKKEGSRQFDRDMNFR